MNLSKQVFKQIQDITSDLIELSLCDDQNFPVIQKETDEILKIEIQSPNVALALKERAYSETYEILLGKRSYNIKMIDGALLVMQYLFRADELLEHRLAFFPNPNLVEFQNNSNEYWDDDIYLDVLDKRIVAVPLRFDFDNRERSVVDVEHPASHLTIGQYRNCRIPVSKPLLPCQFVHFIIRNFYHTAYRKYCESLSLSKWSFDETISENERRLIHINIG